MFLKELKASILILAVFTVLTGLAYPCAIAGLARLCFPRQAEGSLIVVQGRAVGSALIGQPFDDPKYFWGRPSATTPPYNASSSAGSNLGPINPDLMKAVKARIEALRAADPENEGPIPVDLVTSSASGLDPHVSLAAAYYQAPRVAGARRLSESDVLRAIKRHTRGRLLGIWGEPVVNVLELNLDLDGIGKNGE